MSIPTSRARLDGTCDERKRFRMTNRKISGSCLCGGIRYEAVGPLETMARCHCTQCRKASGAEFATNATVAASGFRFLNGEELLRSYESSPGNWRCFCERCGSPILKRTTDSPRTVRLRLGCLDTDLDQKPIVRVFVGEKLGFTEILDDIPRLETLPVAKSSD